MVISAVFNLWLSSRFFHQLWVLHGFASKMAISWGVNPLHSCVQVVGAISSAFQTASQAPLALRYDHGSIGSWEK